TNWTVAGAESAGLDEARGWSLKLAGAGASVTTPAFDVDSFVVPILRVKWSARGLGAAAQPFLEWTTAAEPEFSPARRMYFGAVPEDGAVHDADLPLHTHPAWGGRLTRLRIHFANAPGAEVTLKAVFTAVDSRHNVNNALYLQGCDDYLRWTGDLDFLRRNLPRMRLALHWAVQEFGLRTHGWVRTPWVGHDGRSGHDLASGQRRLRHGQGIGDNYWDLMPFGGEDALATIYYHDALRRMARLERAVRAHPEWNLPAGPLAADPEEWETLAARLRGRGGAHFWNAAAGRFGACRDFDGVLHDYGYSFLNNEAVYFGFATDAQARSIRDWLDGRRTVPGDTSTGADIYHWRFGPRATTRRNVEWYVWAWSDPASIPWGGQVQDGGAVLGFSYHDLMARLRVNGPDDAWARLREVIAWFDEVQRAGGYRAYYAAPGRGTLQGGGTAGGLGLDHEFFESVLVPQVMLAGFLGFEPALTGAALAPRLPAAWPSLTVRGIRLHDVTLDVTVNRELAVLQVTGQPARALRLVTERRPEGVPLRPGRLEVPL
ncbi:MAG TPA: glycosyl hydrolase family 65 protein, partial [Verrucomicrobiota bacterium]|nr:glycosyl hydrolase family 65 protein [Verrucomicrobiota bacterium]